MIFLAGIAGYLLACIVCISYYFVCLQSAYIMCRQARYKPMFILFFLALCIAAIASFLLSQAYTVFVLWYIAN